MARVRGPLMSFAASGTVAGAITFATWRGVEYVRQWFRAYNPKTPAQTTIRAIFKMAVNAWHFTLTAPQRLAWEDDASRPAAMSGFNYHERCYINAMRAGTTPPVNPP